MSRTIETSREWEVFPSRKGEVGTRKFATPTPLPTSPFQLPTSSASHFRLPTSSAFAQTTPGTTLGFSAKEERI